MTGGGDPMLSAGSGSVVITQREIYDEVRNMRSEFSDVCAEVKGMRSDLREALNAKDDHETRLRDVERRLGEVESHQEHQSDHAQRLRSVETKVVWWSGIAVVIGAGGSAVLSAAAKALIGG